MISIPGTWYDGKTSTRIPVLCLIYDNGTVKIEHTETRASLFRGPFSKISASDRLANTPRFLYFPDGQKFETDENSQIDQTLKRFGRSPRLYLVHLLERRWAHALLALAVLLIILWGVIQFGIPLAAKKLAYLLPESIPAAASKQTRKTLDRSIFQPSELAPATRIRLQEHFKPVIEAHSNLGLSVMFRKGGPIGPNAFALPDGTIFFTDEMVRLAEHDDELLSVLVHEAGHVFHRHGLRMLIQDSLLGFALLAITGDATGSSELFLGLPVLLTELSFSRQFEWEADAYVLGYLQRKGIPTVHFARLMRRINQQTESRPMSGRWSNYLSTHPLTEDRLRPFLQESDGRSG